MRATVTHTIELEAIPDLLFDFLEQISEKANKNMREKMDLARLLIRSGGAAQLALAYNEMTEVKETASQLVELSTDCLNVLAGYKDALQISADHEPDAALKEMKEAVEQVKELQDQLEQTTIGAQQQEELTTMAKALGSLNEEG